MNRTIPIATTSSNEQSIINSLFGSSSSSILLSLRVFDRSLAKATQKLDSDLARKNSSSTKKRLNRIYQRSNQMRRLFLVGANTRFDFCMFQNRLNRDKGKYLPPEFSRLFRRKTIVLFVRFLHFTTAV